MPALVGWQGRDHADHIRLAAFGKAGQIAQQFERDTEQVNFGADCNPGRQRRDDLVNQQHASQLGQDQLLFGRP